MLQIYLVVCDAACMKRFRNGVAFDPGKSLSGLAACRQVQDPESKSLASSLWPVSL
jgi:hypothetical protein